MRFLSSFNPQAACFAIALVAIAPFANAAEIKLHVPVAARFGTQMLSPGDYKFDFSPSTSIAKVSGNGKDASVFVTSLGKCDSSGHAFLKIVDVQGVPTITEFGSRAEGVSYDFAVPKNSPKS